MVGCQRQHAGSKYIPDCDLRDKSRGWIHSGPLGLPLRAAVRLAKTWSWNVGGAHSSHSWPLLNLGKV